MSTSLSVTVKNRLRPRLSRDVAARLGRDRDDPMVREIVAAGSTQVWLERQLRAADVPPAEVELTTQVEPAPPRAGRRLALAHVAAVLHLTRSHR